MPSEIDIQDVPAAHPFHLDQTTPIPDFSLTDKVILVSGAGRGLGLALAEALLEAGAKVYALDYLKEPVRVTTCDTNPHHQERNNPR